jgi:hypothetical protein
MNPLTAERIARNDSAFRDANEGIGLKAREYETAEDQPGPVHLRVRRFELHCDPPTHTWRVRGYSGGFAPVPERPRS